MKFEFKVKVQYGQWQNASTCIVTPLILFITIFFISLLESAMFTAISTSSLEHCKMEIVALIALNLATGTH